MKMNVFRVLIVTAVVCAAVSAAFGQAKRYGKICGDPNVRCVGTQDFKAWEMKFALPKNSVIYESEFFYAIILKSVKLKQGGDCVNAIAEDDRTATQALFPKNKVFALKCYEPGDISYTNVADDVSFLAVYAGKTQAEANSFLKTVKTAGKFPGATIRRMRAVINGT
ncbi:MAG: hypothetical protein ABI878_14160 [Acidobacteriota bacterium]